MTVLMIASAPETDISYVKSLAEQADYIVCADGGVRHAQACGIQPDLVIGDFDSGSKPDGVSVIALPPEKDYSDLMHCTMEVLQYKPDVIYYACASGGRIDHFLSNLSLLEYVFEQGSQAVLYDSRNRVTFHGGGTKEYSADSTYKYIGIIPLDQKLCGVTLRGLKYELTDAEVSRSGVITLSNEAAASRYSISIQTGRALVIESRDR